MADNKFFCRMYENEFPKVDDVVMVNVRQIADMGAYVKLLEYGDREGMILLSELSRRRIRSVQKLIRVGRDEVVVVLRVDEEKGYIDLSKRRVTPEDIIKCEEKYNKSKTVHSILRHVAEKNDVPLQDLYETIGWPLYKKFGHAYDAFKVAILDADTVFQGMDIPAEVMKELLFIIKRRMTPHPVKIRAQLDIRCTGIDGVNAIRAALKAGESVGSEDIPVKITYLAAPFYVVTVDSLDKKLGFEIIEKSIEAIKTELDKFAWTKFKVEKEAKLVSDSDDRDFAALLAKAEKENELVSGDEDEGDAVAASDDDM
ncbi:eukaryotic translation initiation factor 2 alpha subunit-domain-containing protein [Choanephora cucurbitarum]|uniref:Eukaryotic translation initiation factor 2 subunit alpha n=1 Tax=Choanephora cucurbitarum TaxID=101091 RepID=A0A1C7N8C6_9FUNG|nr:eukaryotic translation initiation factor 2 alpha subunit-domain-containing protein [Choanephora cucurbitarum]OBZ85331.1 Eukaryotic translation initiation factor 2 subunit alpha [Choanephora cucurbitarum]